MHRSSLLALAASLQLLVSGCGDATKVDSPGVTNIAGASASQTGSMNDPFELMTAADQTWIAIAGTILSKSRNGFTLDYGPATILVEMDDLDATPEGGALKAGDEVIVRGRVDDDLWEVKKIEASSVFVKSLSAYFYASSADEETLHVANAFIPRQDQFSDAIGRVTSVEGREFTVGSGATALQVDTSQMTNDPLDGNGSSRVKLGDRIYVWGSLEIEPEEGAEIMAKGIINLMQMGGSGSQVPASGGPSASPPGTAKSSTAASER
jgi:uncharacterized protein YdeI (BOF family)